MKTSKWITSDRALMRRIIQNLLSNAIRYTAEGKVLIGVRSCGNMLAIEIHDTGQGIPEDKRHFIFEEFRRLHPSSSTDAKAVGLGLAIVDRISKVLGHRVILDSIVGKGSRFAVEVEMAQPRPIPVHDDTRNVNHNSDQRPIDTVIVIENDLQILEGMVELLEARSYRVVPTVSADEALESLETLNKVPSLIIADYHLENGTGVDAISRLRKACGKFIPAVMITADHSSELNAVLQRENIAFLGKPLKPARLFGLLDELAIS